MFLQFLVAVVVWVHGGFWWAVGVVCGAALKIY